MNYRSFLFALILFTTVIACNRAASPESNTTEELTSNSTESTDTPPPAPLDPNTPGAEEKSAAPIDCYDKTLAQPSMKCDDDRRPVCGCNGKTYKNACEAGKAGVIKYQWGPCTKAVKTAVK